MTGAECRVTVAEGRVTGAEGRVTGADGRVMGRGPMAGSLGPDGRVAGFDLCFPDSVLTASDPMSLLIITAWFSWIAAKQSFRSISTSGSTAKWVENTTNCWQVVYTVH